VTAPKKKVLQICAACGGYMRPQSAIEGKAVGGRHYKDETYRRSFGGVSLLKFVCEKCGLVDTFQVDPLDYIQEDA
jgi:hypothetical protein